MGNYNDFAGKIFSLLTCIEDVGRDKHKNVLWRCRCECGKETVVRTRDLLNGHSKSCGCLQQQRVDKRYGRLTVLGEVKPQNGRRFYLCQCDCGAKTVVMAGNLIQGNVKSCGCLKHDTKPGKTHGLSKGIDGRKTRLFRIWTGMKTRCFNQNDKTYTGYGGRGITICPEWMRFENFHTWATENGYKEDLTIERKNNDGDYEPSNCIWIPRGQQALNRRSSKTKKN